MFGLLRFSKLHESEKKTKIIFFFYFTLEQSQWWERQGLFVLPEGKSALGRH